MNVPKEPLDLFAAIRADVRAAFDRYPDGGLFMSEDFIRHVRALVALDGAEVTALDTDTNDFGEPTYETYQSGWRYACDELREYAELCAPSAELRDLGELCIRVPTFHEREGRGVFGMGVFGDFARKMEAAAAALYPGESKKIAFAYRRGIFHPVAASIRPALLEARAEVMDKLDATRAAAERAAAGGDELTRKVDALGGRILAKLGEVQGEAHAAKVAAEAAGDLSAETKSLVKAHLTPRPADYQVTQKVLSGMLAAKNCRKSVREIIRWEQYLKGDLEKGQKPPEGYTLQTRLTLDSASAWLNTYTRKDIGKMKIKVSYEAMTGGRS